jgi:CDP-4-dehydro-6-deoxyglucose reductase, E3
MTTPSFQTAEVINLSQLTDNVYYFIFNQDHPFIFTPGQYVSIQVSDNRINSYSVTSKDNSSQFNLLIDTSPGGVGSQFFKKLAVGDKIHYLGPFGIFTFKPNDGAENILFLATGTGISPIRSLLDSVLKQKQLKIPTMLYLGLRFQKDIFWQDYFENLEKDFPNFKFKLVLSKPEPSWQGLTGHITDHIKLDYPDAKNCSAYICGNKEMIEEAKKILTEAGCPENRIYFEAF